MTTPDCAGVPENSGDEKYRSDAKDPPFKLTQFVVLVAFIVLGSLRRFDFAPSQFPSLPQAKK